MEEMKKENEKNKQRMKTNIIIIIAVLAIIFIATQVFAATNGYGNIFFMIKSIFSNEEIKGQENLLSDRDITISYTSIEVVDGLKIQIQRVTLEESKATVYVFVEDSQNNAPLRYRVYDESNNLIADVTGKNEEFYYTDEVVINKKVDENAKLRVEIYGNSGALLSNITVDLANKELLVNGEQVKRLSEIELKKYLGVFALLSENLAKYSDNTMSVDIDTAINTAIYLNYEILNKTENSQRSLIDNIIKSYLWEEKDIINELQHLSGVDQDNAYKYNNSEFSYYYDVDNDTYECFYPVWPFEPQVCLEISNISYNNGIYTVKFVYCLKPQDLTSLEDIEHYKATIQLKYNKDAEYSKYKIVSITKGEKIDTNNSNNINRYSDVDVDVDDNLNESLDLGLKENAYREIKSYLNERMDGIEERNKFVSTSFEEFSSGKKISRMSAEGINVFNIIIDTIENDIVNIEKISLSDWRVEKTDNKYDIASKKIEFKTEDNEKYCNMSVEWNSNNNRLVTLSYWRGEAEEEVTTIVYKFKLNQNAEELLEKINKEVSLNPELRFRPKQSEASSGVDYGDYPNEYGKKYNIKHLNYGYYDIDKDGVNELIIKTQNGDKSDVIDFVTYKNGEIIKLGSFNGGQDAILFIKNNKLYLTYGYTSVYEIAIINNDGVLSTASWMVDLGNDIANNEELKMNELDVNMSIK